MQSRKRKLLLYFFIGVTFTNCERNAQIHVSVSGNDNHSGTKNQPLATLQAAQQKLRDNKNGGEIIIHEGIYRFSEALKITPQDNGIIFRAADNENVIFTGAKEVNVSWKLWKNGIYKANLAVDGKIDQLFVGGERQHMARYPNYKKFNINPLSDDKKDHKVIPLNGGQSDAWSLERVKSWKNPQGAYLHAMNRQLWGTLHFEVLGKNDNGTLHYEGGWQINRIGYEDRDEIHKTFKVAENVFEELDAPGEWFYNQQEKVLYYYPSQGVDLQLNPTIEIVSEIAHLIEVYGDTKEDVATINVKGGNLMDVEVAIPEVIKPVKNITFSGIHFTGTARTFMKTKEAILRSDWNIYRGGAVHIRGGENIVIQHCTFNQVGGNAIFVDAYNKGINIKSCLFKESGATDVNFVGSLASVRTPMYTYGPCTLKLEEFDNTPGPKSDDYPSDCIVEDCVMTQCGRFEKQSAGINVATSARITIKNNSIFEVPRAAINVCNGSWGGHLIEENLCFNTVLETSDHGAFNSWGRDRFWWPANAKGPRDRDENGVSYIEKFLQRYPDMMLWDAMETSIIRHNKMHCLNGWAIDLDDGSTNYKIYNNICLGGGLKTREGYYREVYNNIIFKYYTCNVPYPAPVYDKFHNNILIGEHYVQSVPGLWQGSLDSTLFHNPNFETTISATAIQNYTRDDAHSLVGNAQFKDYASLDFTVQDNSPALDLGFKNFSMSGFGVVSPALKALVPELIFKAPTTYFANKIEKSIFTKNVLGAKITTLSTDSQMTAYGAAGKGGALISTLPKESVLASYGFKEDDIVYEISGKDIENANKFAIIIKKLKAREQNKVKVLRNQAFRTFVFTK